MQLRRREHAITQQPHATQRSVRITGVHVRYTYPDAESDEDGYLECSPSSEALPEDTLPRFDESALQSTRLRPTSKLSSPRSYQGSGRSLCRRSQKRTQSVYGDERSQELKRTRRDSLLGVAIISDVEIENAERSKAIQATRCTVLTEPIKRVTSVECVNSEQPYSFASGSTSLGLFSRLPREIRDIIYGHAVFLTEAVRPRRCCGIHSTSRERNSCVKHGKQTLDSGRFNLLLVSKEISVEAAYVLHNFGKLELQINWSILPYLHDHATKTMHRLGQLPKNRGVKAMWLNVAQYRTVGISFHRNTSRDVETAGVGNIINLCALLLKACEDVNIKAQPTHRVSLDLGCLFEKDVPFGPVNIYTMLDGDPSLWSIYMFHCDDEEYMAGVSNKAGNALKKLVGLIKQHRGCSQWTIAVGADIDEDRAEAKRWFRALKTDCEKGGVKFVEL